MSTTPPTPSGFDLFEVYEASGSLLFVASYLPDDIDPTDVVYRRPWATAAKPLRRVARGRWEPTEPRTPGAEHEEGQA